MKRGREMVISLVGQHGEQLKAFATSCPIKNMVNFSNECYLKSIGKLQSFKNPGQSYYHYHEVLILIHLGKVLNSYL